MFRIISSAAFLLTFLSAYGQTVINPPTTTTVPTTPPQTTTIVTPTPVSTPTIVTPTPVPTTTPVSPVLVPSTATTQITTVTNTNNQLTCSGLGWNLMITKDLISFASGADPVVRIRPVRSVSPIGDTTGNLQVFSTATNDNQTVTIVLKRNGLGCAMGTPGQTYRYDAFIVFPTKVMAGCCNPSA